MSDLLWEAAHEMRNRLAKLEAYIRMKDPEWDKPPTPEPAEDAPDEETTSYEDDPMQPMTAPEKDD